MYFSNVSLTNNYYAAPPLVVSIWGPHRSKRVGEWLDVRKWRLWDAWLNYVGFTVLHDRGDSSNDAKQPSLSHNNNHQEFDPLTSPAMYAFVPHVSQNRELSFLFLVLQYVHKLN